MKAAESTAEVDGGCEGGAESGAGLVAAPDGAGYALGVDQSAENSSDVSGGSDHEFMGDYSEGLVVGNDFRRSAARLRERFSS